MSRLRLIFLLSLVILAGVFVFALLHIPSGESYPETHRVQIIQAESEWILQYDISNNQDRDIEYTLRITIDGAVYTDSTVVQPGKLYTYIHHIYPEQVTEGKVTCALYEKGKTKPVDQATYYLYPD